MRLGEMGEEGDLKISGKTVINCQDITNRKIHD